MSENEETTLSLIKKLVGFKSINHNFLENPLDSEVNKLQEYLEQYLNDLGLITDKRDVNENQPNLVGVLEGNSYKKNTLILNGHIEAVPLGDTQFGLMTHGKLR